MKAVYLKQNTNNEPAQVVGVSDANAPYSFLEWKQFRPNYNEKESSFHYERYVLEWFKTREQESSASRTFLLRQKYLHLLDQLQVVFSEKEKNEWYSKINLMDEKELLISIPYFAKKLKQVALYYLNLRKKLKKTKRIYNSNGTPQGIQQQIYNTLLETFTSENNELALISDNTVPSLTALKNDIIVEIQELYDGTDYLDKSPNEPTETYYNLFDAATVMYYETKGVSLSSIGDWAFNCLTIDPSERDIETTLSELTASALNDVTDVDLYVRCIEKYMAENKYILKKTSDEVANVTETTAIQKGNNHFYFPGSNVVDPTINLNSTIEPIALSSLSLSGSTPGKTLAEADTVFVKTGDEIKAAWYRLEEYKTEPVTMQARIKENDTTKFLFPYPGYGLSGTEFQWTGYDTKTTNGYDFLSDAAKQTINAVYWDGPKDGDEIKNLFVNETELSKLKATSHDNPDKADQIFLLEKDEIDSAFPLKEKNGAWLFKFDTAVYPIIPNDDEAVKFLWPYQRIQNEADFTEPYDEHLSTMRYAFEGACSPVPVQTLNKTHSIGSASIKTSDVLYKFNNIDDDVIDATECCWLSAATVRNDNVEYLDQSSFGGLFEPGKAIKFIWTGPSRSLEEVFKTKDHDEDCIFSTDFSSLTSLNGTQCTCKQVYYTPFGHPGDQLEEYNRNADFIVSNVDDQPLDFDINSWRDKDGNSFDRSPYVAWYHTKENIGWGNGEWINSSSRFQQPIKLETGKTYFYSRAAARIPGSSYVPYVVTYDYTGYLSGKESKWISAKRAGDEWISTEQESNLVLRPGDFVQYKRTNNTLWNYISSDLVEDSPENRGSIWCNIDYVVLSGGIDPYIIWPVSEKPMGSTSNQYPPISLLNLDVLYWWKITNISDPSISPLIIESPFTTIDKISSWVDSSTGQVNSVEYQELYYANKTAFTFTPPSTGIYTIEVSFKDDLGNQTIFTDIPPLTVVPQFKEQELLVEQSTPACGYLLEQELYGWNYNINRADQSKLGARPFWAKLYFEKDVSTKNKTVHHWGYPNNYLNEYLPDHSPKISNLMLSLGSIVHYKHIGYSFNWIQPIQFNSFTSTSQWCKLDYKQQRSNLSLTFRSKDRPDLITQATTEPSDILLSNIINGFPVEVYYNAINPFQWTTTFSTLLTSAESIVEQEYYAQQPWANLANRYFSTIATIPVMERIYSQRDVGGYFLPQHHAASLYVNKDYSSYLPSSFGLTSDAVVEQIDVHVESKGRSKVTQPSIANVKEVTEWLIEPATSGALAGNVRSELYNDLPAFVPYQHNDSSITTLGLILPESRTSPWGGPNGDEWTDRLNQPQSFTGIPNISAWVESQLLKTNEQTMDSWGTDIYGNQYGVFKNLNGIPVSQRKNTPGKIFVRTNGQKVLPGSTFLKSVFEKFKHETFCSEMTGNSVKTLECLFDTLVIETSSAVAFFPISYSYDTEHVDTSYDHAQYITGLTGDFTYNGSWQFPATKTISTLFTDFDPIAKKFSPIVYEFDLNSKDLIQLFPKTSIDYTDISAGLSSIDIESIEDVLFSYSASEQTYLLTYSAKLSGNLPIVIDFKIKQHETLTIESVDRYVPLGSAATLSTGGTATTTASLTAFALPAVDMTTYCNLSASAGVAFALPIVASNNPTSWTLAPGHPAGVSLTNTGMLNGIFAAPGIHFLNYIVTNANGSVTYPLTLTII